MANQHRYGKQKADLVKQYRQATDTALRALKDNFVELITLAKVSM